MIYTCSIPLETPSKKNSRINTRSGRSFPSRQYQEWHAQAMSYMKMNGMNKSIHESVRITFSFIHGDLRRRDSDNQVSSILDLLMDAEIISDDNWSIVREIVVHNSYQKGNPRCDILITDV